MSMHAFRGKCWTCGHDHGDGAMPDFAASPQPAQAEPGAVTSNVAQPAALVWHEGPPPFPQDQEWFIAETAYGDRVVLRSLDEGRNHHGNYAFKTADETYMKAELVKRWMQFPDCEFLPPKKPAAQPEQPEPGVLTDAHIEFALNCNLEDPSDDESSGFYAGARWAEAFLSTRKLSDEQVERIMEAVDVFADRYYRHRQYASRETTYDRVAARAEVERLLRG